MHLVVMIVGGILGGVAAHNKGRSLLFWTLACGILPLLLLVLLALPRLPQEGVWRPCPFCLRIIPWQARACSFCRRDVPAPRCAPCDYCNAVVWAGQSRCSRCGNPAPWTKAEPDSKENTP